MVNISVYRVIAYNSMGTPFSKRKLNYLIRSNKVIRNIPLYVYLIRMIIIKFGPKCFGGIY
jgi:hypothetical protein